MLRIELNLVLDVNIVNGKFEVKDSDVSCVNVFACTDGLKTCIGSVNTVSELEDLISPEKIIQNIRAQASEDEIYTLEASLYCNDNKYLNHEGKVLKAID